jgi:SAM-dependent methyltransferase
MNLKSMSKINYPDKNKYDFKEPNYINGIPFPRLPTDLPEAPVPLKEEYLMRSMDYLDTPEASPIFEKQADIVMERGYKGILDVGCRHGPINEILNIRGYTDYQYFGFDTSPQPIEYANEMWETFENIEYKVASWWDEIPVDFDVDCIIWSGVLLYEPERHFMIFNDLQKYYNCRGAIIQEPMMLQRDECWREGLKLNTIEDQLHMYDCFKVDHHFIDVPVFSGKRIILDVRL